MTSTADTASDSMPAPASLRPGDRVALASIPTVPGTVELVGDTPDGPYALIDWGPGGTSPEPFERLVLAGEGA